MRSQPSKLASPEDISAPEIGDDHDADRMVQFMAFAVFTLSIGFFGAVTTISYTDPGFFDRMLIADIKRTNIDPIAVGDIRDLVAHLKDRGIGVLITDHNVRETIDVIDRAYIIHDGMMLMEGAPSDIVGNEDVRRVYLGDRFRL